MYFITRCPEYGHDLFFRAGGLGRIFERPVNLFDMRGQCRTMFIGVTAYRDHQICKPVGQAVTKKTWHIPDHQMLDSFPQLISQVQEIGN